MTPHRLPIPVGRLPFDELAKHGVAILFKGRQPPESACPNQTLLSPHWRAAQVAFWAKLDGVNPLRLSERNGTNGPGAEHVSSGALRVADFKRGSQSHVDGRSPVGAERARL